MNTNILFISDLHLEENQLGITELFLQFMQTQALQADQLYILGDFFEAWIGDDDNTPYYQKIKDSIKNYVTQGKQCFIMPGNRDFLIGKRFMRETGAQYLPDPTIIEHNNSRILLTHGDAMCTDDIRHQIYRRISQSQFAKVISNVLPINYRKKIAQQLRAASRKHFLRHNAQLRDVTAKAVQNAFTKNNIDVIIHGHTHVAGAHEYDNNKKRFVLGAWHETGHAWELTDSFKEIRISPTQHSKPKE